LHEFRWYRAYLRPDVFRQGAFLFEKIKGEYK